MVDEKGLRPLVARSSEGNQALELGIGASGHPRQPRGHSRRCRPRIPHRKGLRNGWLSVLRRSSPTGAKKARGPCGGWASHDKDEHPKSRCVSRRQL